MAYHRVGAARGPVVNREVERLRRTLPINQYLYMFHIGATSGHLPRLDDTGAPLPLTEQDALSTAQRIDLTKTLLDKSMPDAKYDSEADAIPATLLDREEVHDMPSEQLARLLCPAPKTDDILTPAKVREI